ncbi:hypothetical protein N9L68_03355 [bacterium]|nr:hypothetical protein [bacterium]
MLTPHVALVRPLCAFGADPHRRLLRALPGTFYSPYSYSYSLTTILIILIIHLIEAAMPQSNAQIVSHLCDKMTLEENHATDTPNRQQLNGRKDEANMLRNLWYERVIAKVAQISAIDPVRAKEFETNMRAWKVNNKPVETPTVGP